MRLMMLAVVPMVLMAGPGVGEPAPDFTEPDTAFQPHSLSDFRYKTVMLHFWHTS
ncbi:hypothetical protein DRP53_09195 [candidate division WOR-3 bacterium]|uniref:Alkyl hydroperoxide reductase subunit C/ Thiol specific antioxidant domain-containing protein n=1 Tax=candidate division WOR-3 bacterium TaxID=2052148 RepID=A0A660SE81_UNCW3|nr:MAG: hypothetical protein DRP53_09195 [candidate division WOR-3 bacterium]